MKVYCDHCLVTADVQLCSSPELMFDYENSEKPQYFTNDSLIDHLGQKLDACKSEIAAKNDYITTLEEDLAVKNDIIKEQNETIRDYRKDIQLEDSDDGKVCPLLQHQRMLRRRRKRRVKRQSDTMMMCRDSDTEEWSEPDTTVSLQR